MPTTRSHTNSPAPPSPSAMNALENLIRTAGTPNGISPSVRGESGQSAFQSMTARPPTPPRTRRAPAPINPGRPMTNVTHFEYNCETARQASIGPSFHMMNVFAGPGAYSVNMKIKANIEVNGTAVDFNGQGSFGGARSVFGTQQNGSGNGPQSQQGQSGANPGERPLWYTI